VHPVIVSSSEDSLIKFWDIRNGACLKQFYMNYNKIYPNLVSVSREDVIITVHKNKIVQWDS